MAGSGVGLENVRQRLKLCFGESAAVNIDSSDTGSTVSFSVPHQHVSPVVRQEVVPA
jgi:sensor histidine kinase YesM